MRSSRILAPSSRRRSSIVDGPSTMVIDGRLAKVLIWYDNEYGYVFRMAELAAKVATAIAGGDVR